MGTITFELLEYGIELGERLVVQRIGAGVLLVEQQPGDAVLVGPHSPMFPRRSVLARLADGERPELEVSRVENVQDRLRGYLVHGRPLQIASISMAPPCPPPMHSVAMPRL